MNAAMILLVAGTVLMEQPPDEFFGKPQNKSAASPVSGPVIGENLPYQFGAVQASGKFGASLSYHLE